MDFCSIQWITVSCLKCDRLELKEKRVRGSRRATRGSRHDQPRTAAALTPAAPRSAAGLQDLGGGALDGERRGVLQEGDDRQPGGVPPVGVDREGHLARTLGAFLAGDGASLPG